jgi:hypothetical protein
MGALGMGPDHSPGVSSVKAGWATSSATSSVGLASFFLYSTRGWERIQRLKTV